MGVHQHCTHKNKSSQAKAVVQALLAACLEAALPLHTVHTTSYNCFCRETPIGFLQLRSLKQVSLKEASLRQLPDGPWLHQLTFLDLSDNSLERIPPVLAKYKGMFRTLILFGALEKAPAFTDSEPESSTHVVLSNTKRTRAAARGKIIYQELLDAGVDVQTDKNALLCSDV